MISRLFDEVWFDAMLFPVQKPDWNIEYFITFEEIIFKQVHKCTLVCSY